MTFEQIVKVTPAFDKRSNEPGKNYGIGACRITFILKGDKGAVQFMIGTDWHVPTSREHLATFPPTEKKQRPDGWDLGYHSKEPMYEDQSTMKCDLFDCGECYYDGSSLNADEMVEDFVSGGTNYLWPKLEDYYNQVFNDESTGARQ